MLIVMLMLFMVLLLMIVGYIDGGVVDPECVDDYDELIGYVNDVCYDCGDDDVCITI